MPRVNRVSGHIRLIVILDHSEISTPVSIVLKMQELGTAGYCSYKKKWKQLQCCDVVDWASGRASNL